MNNGWILIHRKLIDAGYYKKPQYLALWIHLLLMANHDDTEFLWNGKIQKVKRGQLLTGRNSLSADIGIPPTNVERILKLFESEHQIGQQKTTKWRLITIYNYAKYQLKDSKVDNKRTTDGQQVDNKRTHTMNIKNEKNVNKKTYTPLFEIFWKEYPKKVGKPKAYSEWKKLSLEERSEIMKDIPLRMVDRKWKGGFIKDPERYIKNRQWEDEILPADKPRVLKLNS